MVSQKMRLRLRIAAAIAILAVGALAGPSLARSPDERKQRKACTTDAFTLCPLQALTGNRNGVRDCLLKRMDKLSEPCVAVIHEAQEKSLAAAVAQQQALAASAAPAPVIAH
jgi:hypothetical protein